MVNTRNVLGFKKTPTAIAAKNDHTTNAHTPYNSINHGRVRFMFGLDANVNANVNTNISVPKAVTKTVLNTTSDRDIDCTTDAHKPYNPINSGKTRFVFGLTADASKNVTRTPRLVNRTSTKHAPRDQVKQINVYRHLSRKQIV